jgi:hypothetical protein
MKSVQEGLSLAYDWAEARDWPIKEIEVVQW